MCDGRLSFVDNVLTVTWRSVSDGHGSEKVDRLRITELCLRCSISHSRTFSSLPHPLLSYRSSCYLILRLPVFLAVICAVPCV